jgi:predicted transcriptional regulator
MNDKDSSIITEFVSVEGNELLSNVASMFKEKTREILVFEEKDVFLGYLTKRYVTHQSKVQPNTTVSNLIKRVPTVSKDSAPDVIARALLSEKIFSVPVVDDGHIIGVIRDIDLLRDSEDIFGSKRVIEVMTQNPIVVTAKTSVAKFITICRTNNISRTPVVDESNQLVGIMSPHDTTDLILSESLKRKRGDKKAGQLDVLSVTVEELMTQEVVTCNENDFLIEAIVKLEKADHKALIVIDMENHPVGIITTTDLLETVSMPPETEGYYLRVLGDVEDSDMEDVIEMGIEIVKKYADIIGTSGQLYIHAKAIPKRKFRGSILYQVRVRISTNKGKTYVSRSDGYGIFGAFAVALDRIEREIVSERELEIQSQQTGSTRYILEEIEEL